jgi:hypothetical protein
MGVKLGKLAVVRTIVDGTSATSSLAARTSDERVRADLVMPQWLYAS